MRIREAPNHEKQSMATNLTQDLGVIRLNTREFPNWETSESPQERALLSAILPPTAKTQSVWHNRVTQPFLPLLFALLRVGATYTWPAPRIRQLHFIALVPSILSKKIEIHAMPMGLAGGTDNKLKRICVVQTLVLRVRILSFPR
jgi:hypothetical protein